MGLGLEDGMKSGGAFYSSGPSLLEENLEFGVNEPWIGQWKDDLLKVTCKDQQKTPFRELTKHPEYVVTTDQGSSCEENELCVPREMCPTHNDTYNKLKTLPKNSKEAKEIIKNLRKKRCNIREKGLCCNLCLNPEESCLELSQCPGIQMKLNLLESHQMKHSESIKVYNQLQSKLCSQNRGKNKFCCTERGNG